AVCAQSDSLHTRLPLGADVRTGVELSAHTIEAPLRWHARQWAYVPLAVAGIAALTRADRPVQQMMLRNHGTGASDVASAVEPFGALYAGVALVGLYGSGVALDRPGLRRAAVEGTASALVAAGVLVNVLKLATGRARPREDLGVYSFRFFGSGRSFPSGHTAGAFSVASVLAEE